MVPSPVDPVKLFVGVLAAPQAPIEGARSSLIRRFGPIDLESAPIPFSFTDYYEKEMGAPLQRLFWSFERLIPPESIAEIKLATNEIEQSLALDGRRTVNLDPGYLDTYKVILATAKGAGQKIHLRDGIWADLAVTFVKGRVKFFDWGFPDYKSGRYDKTLLAIRARYKSQRRVIVLHS